MRGYVPLDPQSRVSQEHYAVVYVPRRSRRRFPKACVDVKVSKLEAIAQSNPDKMQYAARVIGPSKSSEGQYIYYLLEWLFE
ncbi:hypothetical protein MNBD_GAMMA22-2625 [hydrothermal vent metagenome]|uniref:Uncharacterized protein n=1 Tax=hydrothermal vent metagenome TaxID=652676 RepID=A0A3B0ZUL7_9ZZZZ